MGNFKILPEHIQLLNGLIPHLGKKDRETADRSLNVLKLLSGQAVDGRLESMLKLMSTAWSKSNNDVVQALGTLMKNFNTRSKKSKSSDSGSSFLVFLILILLLQEFNE